MINVIVGQYIIMILLLLVGLMGGYNLGYKTCFKDHFQKLMDIIKEYEFKEFEQSK